MHGKTSWSRATTPLALDRRIRTRRAGRRSHRLGERRRVRRFDLRDLRPYTRHHVAWHLRDEARQVAPRIGREVEFETFDRLVGALPGTREDDLASARARARHAGTPYDPERLHLFEILYRELRAVAPVARPVRERNVEARSTLAFFEAYFSNFIEGTEFEVEEAAAIVFRQEVPRDRPADAHDILGTWRLVSDPSAPKALSQTRNAEPLVRTLDFAQRWVAGTRWADLESTRTALERSHAFMDANEAENAGIRSRLPHAPI